MAARATAITQPKTALAAGRPTKGRLVSFISLSTCLIALPVIANGLPLRINTTPSLPIGLYFISECNALKGVTVVHSLPEPLMRFAKERGYVSQHSKGLLKTVAATAGDHVCWFEDNVWINGEQAASLQSHDRRDRPLPAPTGCKQLSDNEILTFIEGSDVSYDGRYFGAIHRGQVVGCARQVI